jgi:PPOX class probable FMN-dependent enzyme
VHRIRTLKEVEGIVGEASPVTRKKLVPELDESALEFVARSPFALLATADADGAPDVTPRGDGPGFVLVEDARTLVLPERNGNRLVFALRNLLANPQVALIFLIPGTDETLRVHGRAELTRDPALLERLSARGRPALLAVRIRVSRAFFHCAKSFRRAQLWDHTQWADPMKVSFGKIMAPKLGGGPELVETIDRAIEEDYQRGL